MKVLILFALIVACALAGPTVHVFADHAQENCDCELDDDYVCWTDSLTKGGYFHGETLWDNVTGFEMKVKVIKGSFSYMVMDNANYNKFYNNRYGSYSYTGVAATQCDDLYLQMEYENKWHIVGICESDDGCQYRSLSITQECSAKETKSACVKYVNCGWCDGVDNDASLSVCMPGNKDSGINNAVCTNWTNFWGVYGIWIIIGCAVCCLACIACCGCICYCACCKKRRPRHHNMNQTYVQQQAPVMLLPQQPVMK
eukprot:TRINITY_DN775888_c0_g1_i1.p1 TRINITY_DN775888_c0_g1~~TRINITY_DN775888_c0_g1_i1.p1  ORF type:complete len:256 (+),score=52.79 TRINITY_DN775888_c0_g1_i1:44-811(+)